EPNSGDRAVLLGTEQVPRAPDLEVPQRDLESLAQLVKAGDDVEAFVCAFGQRAARVVKKVGVSPPPRAAHAAAQLIELSKTETIRALDQYRVHVGDVETRLDDGRADQHVVLGSLEVDHHVGKLVFRHLPVTYGHARLRHQPAHALSGLLNCPHPVVHVVDLATA